MLARVHGVEVELVGGLVSRDGERDLAVLRIVQEALHNALRHARARRIVVRLGTDRIEITDDGAGFDPARAELRSRHLGLTSMEERARELGGRLEIRSAAGAGTTVSLELPTDRQASDG
jgi:signal transduction histidine kinase